MLTVCNVDVNAISCGHGHQTMLPRLNVNVM